MQYLCYSTIVVGLFVLSNAGTHNSTHLDSPCDGIEKASTLLDFANDFINKAKNLYPDCIDDDLQCGRKEKSLAFLEVASNLITGVKKTFPTCPDPECPTVPEPECPTVPEPDCPTVPEPECPTVSQPECPTVPETKCPTVPEPVCPTVPDPECPKVLNLKPVDCSEIHQAFAGFLPSGVYTIWPKGFNTSDEGLLVYCDMERDGGGWTVIQRRGRFSIPPNAEYFYRDWNSFKIGFGVLQKEFWLGNDNIHAISNQGNYTIRFDLKDDQSNTGYVKYNNFWMSDEQSQYTLRISSYYGNIGGYMESHDNCKFSTKDRRNDQSKKPLSCAKERKGAWWYCDNCGLDNLNGLNYPGEERKDGIIWWSWKRYVSLLASEMKLRPQNYKKKELRSEVFVLDNNLSNLKK